MQPQERSCLLTNQALGGAMVPGLGANDGRLGVHVRAPIRQLRRSRGGANGVRSGGGAVAQMGERCNRTAEVRGSIPLSSTSRINDLSTGDRAGLTGWR